MNAISRHIFIFTFFMLSAVHADDTLIIKNRAPRTVYLGIYHQELPAPDKKPRMAQLATSRTLIESGTDKHVTQAVRKTGFDRIMTCAENRELLKPELSNEDLLGEKYNGKNVGDMQGNTFYIGEKDAKFYIYNPTEWKVNQPFNEKECSKTVNALPAIVKNPYRDQVAKVRIGKELSEGERAFLTQRLPKVHQLLQKAFGTNSEKPIKIAVVCNGTGMRSALYCLGALRGLQSTGILDITTYIASAAGATWGISSWYSSGMELQHFDTWLQKQLSNGITAVNSIQATSIGQALMTKFVSGQPLGAVDMYGALLSNVMCGWSNDPQQVYLSRQADRIKKGELPMPLYTVARVEHTAVKQQVYEWNPFEVGSIGFKMYVPVWGFGRKFDKGLSVNNAPELTLGNFMGMWGFQRSGVITQQLDQAALDKKMMTECAKNLVTTLYENLDSYRSFEAQVPNFMRGISKSPIPYSLFLSVTDANASMASSAYPVVSGQRGERAVDVLIFVDASEKLDALENARDYAKKHSLSFVDASFEKIKDTAITVLKGTDKEPLVIYLPLVVDEKVLRSVSLKYPALKARAQSLQNFDIYKCIGQGACASDNFVYTTVQAQQLSDLGLLNVLGAHEKIQSALMARIKNQ